MITNPILPGFNPDPSIVRVGQNYYIATSTFEWYPGVQIHHSTDLQNWRLVCRPLNRASLLDMRGNPDSCGVWAPCLSWHDGLFYLIYTDVKRFDGDYKDSHNYLTTCATIDGLWSERVFLNSSGFDPSLFHDEGGKKWLVNMVWDHRKGRNRFGGIYLQEYCPNKQKLVGDISNIFSGTDLGCTEAPHIYKKNSYYYLLTAEGGTGFDHAITMARSHNLQGPYEVDPQGYVLTAKDHPELLIQRSGHGDLVETQNGEHYLVHLCGRPLTDLKRCTLGRETAIQRVYWSEDGWLRLKGAKGNGLPQSLVTAPNLPLQTWQQPANRQEFDSHVLPLEFQWLRSPHPERLMSLTQYSGHLRLLGKESLGSTFEQALVARREQSHQYLAQTKMYFQPNNFQQTAGLVCYYNGHKFHYCYISVTQDKHRFVDIMSCKAQPNMSLDFPLKPNNLAAEYFDPRFALPPTGAISIRAEVDHHQLQFSWSLDEKNWQLLPTILDHSLLSDEAGENHGANFTGAFIGMACQDTSGANCPADFAYFEYTES
jgi:xylan 1,4-beta-xylosidase